jgi:hypothetical protein
LQRLPEGKKKREKKKKEEGEGEGGAGDGAGTLVVGQGGLMVVPADPAES